MNEEGSQGDQEEEEIREIPDVGVPKGDFGLMDEDIKNRTDNRMWANSNVTVTEDIMDSMSALQRRLQSHWAHLAPLDEDLRSDLLDQGPWEKGSVVRGRRTIALDNQELQFDAYDCSTPSTKVTIMAASASKPCKERVAEAPKVSQALTLLQKATRTFFPIQQVVVTRTRMAYYCDPGTYHTVMAPDEWNFDEPYLMTPAETNRVFTEHRMVNPENMRQLWHVTMNATTQHASTAAGGTWATPTSLECIGHGFKFIRMQYYGAQDKVNLLGLRDYGMVTYIYKIRTATVWATHDVDGKIRLAENDLLLPCRLDEEWCGTAWHGSFRWKKPSPEVQCPLYRARSKPVLGIVINDKGRDVFLASGPKEMLRLEMKKGISMCGGVVYPTDFPNLFLTEDSHLRPFNRDLHPSEASIFAYINQQDSFLYRDLTDAMEITIRHIQGRECQEDQRREQAEYARQAAEQGALLDGDTARLFENHFVTSAGEVWYRYQCRPIQVQARRTTGCYSSLPVSLSEEDFTSYLASRASLDNPTGDESLVLTADSFFMEPKSRRITTSATQTICAPPFSPSYRNKHRRWIVAQEGGYVMGQEPLELQEIDWDDDGVGAALGKDFDFTAGGAYDVDFVGRFEAYTQAPRAGTGVSMEIAVQNSAAFRNRFRTDRDPSYPRDWTPVKGSQVFPDLGNVPTAALLGFMKGVYAFFERYFQLCVIILGTFAIWRIVMFFLAIGLRLCTEPVVGNPILHVICAFVPSLRGFLKSPGRWFRNLCQGKARRRRRRRRTSSASSRSSGSSSDSAGFRSRRQSRKSRKSRDSSPRDGPPAASGGTIRRKRAEQQERQQAEGEARVEDSREQRRERFLGQVSQRTAAETVSLLGSSSSPPPPTRTSSFGALGAITKRRTDQPPDYQVAALSGAAAAAVLPPASPPGSGRRLENIQETGSSLNLDPTLARLKDELAEAGSLTAALRPDGDVECRTIPMTLLKSGVATANKDAVLSRLLAAADQTGANTRLLTSFGLGAKDVDISKAKPTVPPKPGSRSTEDEK